jgi:uncharacterized phage protein (TIGR01671 family)
MSREIKFRGKRPHDGKWIYGSLVTGLFGNIVTGVMSCNILDTDEHPEFDCFQDLDDMDTDVITESVGQFTGRKDSTGKDIYEGDILKHHGIVSWNDVELCWSRIDLNWNDNREWSNLDSLTSPMIVIGNIYENPELLK